MNKIKNVCTWFTSIVATGCLVLLLAGCEGDDGRDGVSGSSGTNGVGLPLAAEATSLSMTITSVTINSAPVVNFTVTNQQGLGAPGLTTGDLRFSIAKLITTASPPQWQNYVLTKQDATVGPGAGRSAVQATRENNGTLVDHGDGSYTYTFGTDIAAVVCPMVPCEDAFGNALDLSYVSTLTHRVGVQTRGSIPAVNAVYTFRPSDGATTGIETLDIVKTEKCNECHDLISAHDARINTEYCVICHNPGSVDPSSIDPLKDTPAGQPAYVLSSGSVDFKVMIHKIHRGKDLPSIVLGPNLIDEGGAGDDGTGEYAIWGYRNTEHNFSDIGFPQDIRNCTKCHDGADPDTPQGDNWITSLSMEACGSCHDNIKFDVSAVTDPDNGHPQGAVNDNSTCIVCHETTTEPTPGSVAFSHTLYEKVGAANFLFEVLEICGTPIASDPVCVPSTVGPVVKFRVSDPTGATTHAFGNDYDVRSTSTDEEFSNGAASLNVLMSWSTLDYTNEGGVGTPPARANSVNARSNATSNGDGTFNIVMPDIPGAGVFPGPLSFSGVVAIEGHPASPGESGTFSDAVRTTVKAQVAYFGITDTVPVPRRDIVNITTKCDRCHDVLSLHGSNRSDEAQLCVTCHNPSNTDYNRRPKDVNGLLTGGIDGKDEESIDMRRMIHAIHAASESNFDGTLAHGFREQGILIYAWGGTTHDYSDVRFPGILQKCDTCHLEDTYQLMDRTSDGGANWEFPAQNGIQGSTISTIPGATPATVAAQLASRSDDLKISPISAVCSSCHDKLLPQIHMIQNGGLFGVTQAVIEANYETCALCHGPGKIASVDFVHSEQFGEVIPGP